MKVLGIMGSPRKKGNSAILLEQALAGAEQAGGEVEKVMVAELQIAPCLACGGCERTGECIVHDTMGELYPKLEDLDGLIVATPAFFMGVPAQFKALIDRCQPFWIRKYLLAKPIEKKRAGLLLAVGGTNLPHTFDAVRLEVKSFFHCLDVKYAGEVLVRNVSEHGAVANLPDVLSQARLAGEQLVRSLQVEK